MGTAKGDSGGPIWIEIKINGVMTPIIIAVLRGGEKDNYYSTDIKRQCRKEGIKVTEGLVDWINEISELD